MAQKPSDGPKRLRAFVATREQMLALECERALRLETPRGRVLVATEYCRDLLRRLLRAAMVSNTQAEKLIGDGRPLDSFGNQIRAAAAFGLLPGFIHGNLDRLRDIRNHCAHHLGEVDINHPKIRGNFDKFVIPKAHARLMAEKLPTEDHRQTELLGFVLGTLEGCVNEMIALLTKQCEQRTMLIAYAESNMNK